MEENKQPATSDPARVEGEIFCLDDRWSTTRQLCHFRPHNNRNLKDKFETFLFLPKDKDRQGEGGLRTQGHFKQSLPDNPLITVITVVFNGEKYLEETILSVIGQTYNNVEYIIIDGASTDGTLNIIRKYEHAIDYWISEPDKGIYDAMNKGVDAASGVWLNFMNAGDSFYNSDTINIIELNKATQDILFSDTLIVAKGKFKVWTSSVEKKVFIHQSMIYHKKLHLEFGKYLCFPDVIISDYLFFSLIWNINNSKKIQIPISIYRTDGVSSTNPNHHYQKIAVDLMLGVASPLEAILVLINYFFKQFLKKLIFIQKRHANEHF